MLTDAHCHPYDLAPLVSNAEEERKRLKVLAAASSCDLEEFTYIEELAKKAALTNETALFPCFALHPQMPALINEQLAMSNEQLGGSDNHMWNLSDLISKLDVLASEKRLVAIGECGFDLYDEAFKKTEEEQGRIFAEHLETALKYGLPLVIHARRAMHKIFSFTKELVKCKAVVFHSWAGTLEEGESLLRRGVNVYFSFGNTIINGRKQSMRCCGSLPADRLLTETDAPFAPARGTEFSSWADLPRIIETAASLRREAGSDVCGADELEARIENNFREVFEK
jgi:TatD DNase family protein